MVENKEHNVHNHLQYLSSFKSPTVMPTKKSKNNCLMIHHKRYKFYQAITN